MYVSTEQLRTSMDRLARVHPFFGTAFLAFKQFDLPVGKAVSVNFTEVMSRYLHARFRPLKGSDRYFLPFQRRTSDDGWKAERYASTSLQRIVADTFGDCFIHTKGTSLWAWETNYIGALRKHLDPPLPAFDLAIWLYRDEDFPGDIEPESLVEQFFSDHKVTTEEARALFASSALLTTRNWQTSEIRSEFDYARLLTVPSSTDVAQQEQGVSVQYVRLKNVAPCQDIVYEPDARINLIAGDNSLGKTFLLDTIWWSITDKWPDGVPIPLPDGLPAIEYSLGKEGAAYQIIDSVFDGVSRSWPVPNKRSERAGLSLYARYDGSYGLYDPADVARVSGGPEGIVLKPDELWNGRQRGGGDRDELVTVGLVADWARWQLSSERYGRRYSALEAVLRHLAPGEGETLRPGKLMSPAYDERDIPTVRMPYGDIPITTASAGVKRILGLAYLLVWAWYRHTENSAARQRDPESQIVFLMDEVESHLHPKWQRKILPALMKAIAELAPEAKVQLHVATHSPIVLASSEAMFDESKDQLHHLNFTDGEVVLDRLDFVKRGSVDAWLTWDMFGLPTPRPIEAERAVLDAMRLQLEDNPDPDKVLTAHRRLVRLLADNDPMWVRWNYFAKQHGVIL